jgi:pilus assembly protein CpaE
MPRVLVIDDDEGILKLIEMALRPRGYEVISAVDGALGLNIIRNDRPDVVILDKMMPDMDGYEVARRVRREPSLAQIPILIITAAAELSEKLDAFNAGADDVLVKPFEIDELAARLAALLRRAEAFKLATQGQVAEVKHEAATLVVHSLRGGVGTSSLAVNLAYALRGLWDEPTVILDMVMVAGQVALLLNMSIRRTWADLAGVSEADFDVEALESGITNHDSGLSVMASPRQPSEAEQVSNELVRKSMGLMRPRYEYIVADLPHDFSDVSLDLLEEADTILLVLAPDIVSIRAASLCLNTYDQLGLDKNVVKLVLNQTMPRSGLAGKQIEDALQRPISLVIPYSPNLFVNAVNSGIPFLQSHPKHAISAQLEDYAFRLSKEKHQKTPPAAPSEAWRRSSRRLRIFDETESGKRRGPFKLRLGEMFD